MSRSGGSDVAPSSTSALTTACSTRAAMPGFVGPAWLHVEVSGYRGPGRRRGQTDPAAAAPRYRLVRSSGAPPAPAWTLDAAQQAVVSHTVGPLLVIGGPGTGKTTTLIDAVAARVSEGLDPARILVL